MVSTMSGLCPVLGRTACPRLALPWHLPIRVHGLNRRRRISNTSTLLEKRYKTTEAGEEKSGHIKAGQNEGIFFLDNIFPLKLNFLLGLPFFNTERSLDQIINRFQNANTSPKTLTERAIPASLPIKVLSILPRLKEGGAFVKFSHEPQIQASEIEKTLRGFLKQNPVKPWFNPFRRVSTFLVHGKPWVEDLNRFPSSRLKIEFVQAVPGEPAVELSQEPLYSLFRRYGKLVNIIPQPTDSKEIPRYAYLNFMRVRNAIMAKNCMHGYTVSLQEGGGKAGTVLKLGYERKKKAHWIRDWLVGHPRIIIPAVAAFFAAMTMAIFDPVRTFFIKAHVTHSFHISDNPIYKWLRSQATKANDILSFRHKRTDDAGLSPIWDDRRDDIEQIRTWLIETADTFIVIQGPRGSGKRELVLEQALKGRKNNLVIDCKPIQEARGDSATIGAAALEVGYRPIFSWMNSISSLVDLAAQGTIGTKTGFSETLDTQLDKIWQNTATALKQIALEGRKKDDKDADLSADEYLEAHPERRPVIVIDNFLHKSQEDSLVYDKIAQWAASLTTANIAHAIFLTNDVSFSKSLSKALPDRVFRQISLGDCSPEVAKRIVINNLDAETSDEPGDKEKRLPSQTREDLAELDECIETLGGRLTDLEFLARRIRSGETPKKAIREIIEQSASEILKMFLLDTDDRAARVWSPTQAWLLIKLLAANPSIRYNELLLSDTYKRSGESTLQALEQAELISIVSGSGNGNGAAGGRPHTIKPGKPVYAAAFRLLTGDGVLAAKLDLKILDELVKGENEGIAKYEEELKVLGSFPGQPPEVRGRIKWLLGKVWTGQQKVEQYERESAGLKRLLREKC